MGVKVSLGTGGDSRALDPTGHEVAMTAARGAVCKPHTEAKVSLPGLQSPLASIRPVSPAVWRFEVTVSYHERAACPGLRPSGGGGPVSGDVQIIMRAAHENMGGNYF